MWVAFTILAAWFQSMRTAYQNTLSKQEGTLHATLSRSLFGLPIAVLYSVVCWYFFGGVQISDDSSFYIIAGIGALAQILATYLMLLLFKTTSFTSGTLFAKTEALLTATLGSLFLHDQILSLEAWLIITLGMIGIFILSLKKTNVKKDIKKISFINKSSIFGLACGLCFAITSVAVGYASSELEGSFFTRAAATLIYVLLVQSFLLWAIQAYQTKSIYSPFQRAFFLNCKVGFLSSIGSIGWFTAFSLANPALVKTLGQIEVIGTLYYSKVRFHETLTWQEKVGGGFILMSVIGVLLL